MLNFLMENVDGDIHYFDNGQAISWNIANQVLISFHGYDKDGHSEWFTDAAGLDEWLKQKMAE